MKKTFKCLILFIFLFLVGVRVEADEILIEDWVGKQSFANFGYALDVINFGTNNITIVDYIEKEYDEQQKKYIDVIYGGLIKYDFEGNIVWEIKEKDYVIIKGVKSGSNIIVLGQYQDENLEFSFLAKYDKNGNLIWRKEIDDALLDWSFYGGFISSYGEKVLVSFNDKILLYDENGNLVKSIYDGDIVLPIGLINEDGIFISYVDKDNNTKIEKYNLNDYSFVNSTNYLDALYSNQAIAIEPISIVYDNGYIYVSIIVNDSVSSYGVLKFDDNLKIVNLVETDYVFLDMFNVNEEIGAVGIAYDLLPRGYTSLEVQKFNIYDSMSSIRHTFSLNIYNSDLEMTFSKEQSDYFIFGGDKSSYGFTIAGISMDENDKLYGFTKKYTYINEQYNIDYGKLSMDDEIFSDVVNVGNDYIVVGYVCPYESKGIPDAKLWAPNNCYGNIIKYDKSGNIVWEKRHSDLYTEFFGVVDSGDGVIVLGYDGSELLPILVKYDYNGNLIFTRKVSINKEILYEQDFDINFNNNVIGIRVGNSIYFLDSEGNIFKEFLEEEKKQYRDTYIDKDNIYIIYFDSSNKSIIEKYDYNFNKVDSINVETYIEAIDLIHNELLFVGSEGIWSLDDDMNIEFVFDISYPNNVSFEETKFGMVLTYSGEGCSTMGISDARACEGARRFALFDVDLNLLYKQEVPFYFGAAAANSSGFVLVGHDRDDETYTEYGILHNYSYPSFNVDVSTNGNGTITSNKVLGTAGEEIEFTVEPKEGYVLKRVVVTTSSGEVIEFSDYKFTMPSEDVEIYAEFELIPNNPNTGLSNPLVMLSIIVSAAVIGYLVIKKKKFI